MFSTYSYPETPTVPKPPVPSGTLGVVNPTLINVSTSSISGTLQGEYIGSEMDAKQGVAQYTPIIQNIPCHTVSGKAIYPKGTLVLFTEPQKKPGLNGTMGYPRSRLSEPEAVAHVTFNTISSQGISPIEPTMIFPLSESTEVFPSKSQYIAVSVQDAGEVYICQNNPTVSFKPGDPIYAKSGPNGLYYISEDQGEFYLGTSMVYQCYDRDSFKHNQCRTFQIALFPRKV